MNHLRILARRSLRRRDFNLRSQSRSFCNIISPESNR
ncbi:hypothetical protein CARUB_v100175351mg, partial [Capsella rubella]